jgi:oxygen-independent coproporphyrinogen III oxidase
MQLSVHKDEHTEVGSYFVANYPPFSAWNAEQIPAYLAALSTPAKRPVPPLGLYIHIPFCRKRCKFCYFRVYTDKNSSDVDTYLTALAREAEIYADRAAVVDREFDFVYFGGGTPSFLSAEQLERLIGRISDHWRWEHAREVTFECEPGTLKKSKLETIKSIGTTRLSLGIEHFDDEVLALGGRAHRSGEVFQSFAWAREVGFPQINIDLIAGMVGDTEDKWKETVDKALALDADSVTIYQMEVPHNTEIAKNARHHGTEAGRHEGEADADSTLATPVAGWATKRWWVDYAFRTFEKAGYVVSSGYTLYKPGNHHGFVYRDALWHGADLIGTGVASFGHLAGVHYQNIDSWEGYIESLERGELPISRALPISDRQRLIRELILQLKLGRLDGGYFAHKFGEPISRTFAQAFGALQDDGLLAVHGDEILLSRAGLLRVDSLLPRFFEPQFQNVRYT